MKIVKLFLAGMFALFLAACNNTEALGDFSKEIDKSVKAEQPVQEVGKNLQKLENEKVQIFNKINKAKPEEIKGYADKLLKNADKRNEAIEEEIKVMNKSHEIYDSAKAKTKDIEDESQKKAVNGFIKVNDNKYKKHSDLMDSYKDILNTEKEVFNYLKEPQPDGKVVNKKIKIVTKKYEQFQKDTTSYAKMLRVVDQEKQNITDILNGK
ncbi:YkyA family protein [Macrococcus armenti]|uniref:YkyA family protein n=1 Tax=Macrococcus armenti TaxID=2875764 RepID=A0ABY3ZWU5_9STAP|nr:YkyA family protein [Macrococcus armenti]UOB21267.1 YkyA family protein [Macrococcus armenti]